MPVLRKPIVRGEVPRREHAVPFYVPDDLDALRGPDSGTFTLPLSLDWTPASSYDLSNPRRVKTMYQTVIREAKRPADVEKCLNRDLLVHLWRDLFIPDFIRDAWEQAHPELV